MSDILDSAQRAPFRRWAITLSASLLVACSPANDAASPEPDDAASEQPAASDPQTVEAVESTALDWLALVDDADWNASYEQVAPAMKDSITLEQWSSGMDARGETLGPVEQRSLVRIEPGDEPTAVFRTDYAERSGVTEKVRLASTNGEYLVTAYWIE